MSIVVLLLPFCASVHITIRLKLLHANTTFKPYVNHTFSVTHKCIAMLSVKNSSILWGLLE